MQSPAFTPQGFSSQAYLRSQVSHAPPDSRRVESEHGKSLMNLCFIDCKVEAKTARLGNQDGAGLSLGDDMAGYLPLALPGSTGRNVARKGDYQPLAATQPKDNSPIRPDVPMLAKAST